MKRLTATVIGAFALLIFVVSPAHAITISRSELNNGNVRVTGSGAVPFAPILWEGSAVATANKVGRFNFSTTVLPSDCVGELSDEVMIIQVGVGGCTTQQVVGGGGVFATGQTTSFAAGDDGDLQKGLSTSPDPRFTDNLNGTITDNLTGLIWLKDASCLGVQSWVNALGAANTLADGNVACGLSDGSVAGAWRLPNRNELTSLLDLGTFNPALPAGHPFVNFVASGYWSSTTNAGGTNGAWGVDFDSGACSSAVSRISSLLLQFAAARDGYWVI